MTNAPRRPLFPLELVLLPRERIPLHIFELRYQALVRRYGEEKIPFGVISMREGQIAEVGCAAHIEQVLRRFDDGRSHILVRGGERFRTQAPSEHADGYLEATWVPFEDDEAEASDPDARETLERLHQEFAKLREGLPIEEEQSLSASEPIEDAEPVEPYSFLVAARCGLGVERRQAVLASRSEREREEILIEHLVREIPKLKKRRADMQKVRTNGHVHGSGS